MLSCFSEQSFYGKLVLGVARAGADWNSPRVFDEKHIWIFGNWPGGRGRAWSIARFKGYASEVVSQGVE